MENCTRTNTGSSVDSLVVLARVAIGSVVRRARFNGPEGRNRTGCVDIILAHLGCLKYRFYPKLWINYATNFPLVPTLPFGRRADKFVGSRRFLGG
jgi:hypothetical protein